MGRNKANSAPNYLLFLFMLLSTNLVTYFLSSSSVINSCLPFKSNTPKPMDDSSSSNAFVSESQKTMSRNHSRPSLKDAEKGLPPEYVAFAYGQPLPFGFNLRFDSDTLYSSVGWACSFYKAELGRYMSYDVNGSCPDDEHLAQKLLLKGYSSVVWTAYSCKNYSCLVNRWLQKGSDDCKDCFNLKGM
ncbi:hypothetical protein Ancab_008281 [Ancistrocladus abbreviatus]